MIVGNDARESLTCPQKPKIFETRHLVSHEEKDFQRAATWLLHRQADEKRARDGFGRDKIQAGKLHLRLRIVQGRFV